MDEGQGYPPGVLPASDAARRHARGRVLLASPAHADDNNGNWRTAQRWRGMLQNDWQCILCSPSARGELPAAEVLIALHARHSAAVVQAWKSRGSGPVVLVLTGTDLYRDIACDESAQACLRSADRIVVLQEQGLAALPAPVRARARCIFQSTPGRPAASGKSRQRLRALMVGHLRAEKSPETYFAAAQVLDPRRDIILDHIGAELDPQLGAAARALGAALPRYRYLGGRTHAEVLHRIRRAHVLVHCSRVEGGAHVVMEAVCSGTPVLASRIPGNVGMLGEDYPGYFEWGDAQGLADLLRRCRAEQARPDGFLARLAAECAERAHLFAPMREQDALLQLLAELLPLS